MVDPVGFGAGYGAGQGAERQNTDAANVRAKRAKADAFDAQLEAENSRGQTLAVGIVLGAEIGKLRGELEQQWIPYARTLRASIFGRNVERQMLQDALRKSDPSHAEEIIQQADEAREAEYHQNYDNKSKFDEVTEVIVKESKEL